MRRNPRRYSREFIDLLTWSVDAGEVSIFEAAQRMNFCGFPIHIALRVLAGRKE